MGTQNRLVFLGLMALGIILEVSGDIFLKKWANDGRRWGFVTGFLLYLLGSIGWAWSLKYEGLSKAVTIFMLANVILALMAGHMIFGERLSPWNWLGVGLACAAIILCEV